MNLKKKIIIGCCGVAVLATGIIFYNNERQTYKNHQLILENKAKIDGIVGKNEVKSSIDSEQKSTNQIKNIQGSIKDADDIRAILRAKYSNSFGESSTVTWNDKLYLYEVVNGLQVLYITPNGKNVVSGHVYDLNTGLDYTDVKIAEISKINVKDLPLNKFVKLVNGDGSRPIYVFAYLDDQFKQYYTTTLANINNASIYVLLNRATYTASDDDYIRTYKDKSFRAIYCSDDSERELKNYLKPAKWNPITNLVDNCNQKISDDNLNGIFDKYKIVWSPTLFMSNGYRYKALPDYQINQILNKSESNVSKDSSKDQGISSQMNNPNSTGFSPKPKSSVPIAKSMGANF